MHWMWCSPSTKGQYIQHKWKRQKSLPVSLWSPWTIWLFITGEFFMKQAPPLPSFSMSSEGRLYISWLGSLAAPRAIGHNTVKYAGSQPRAHQHPDHMIVSYHFFGATHAIACFLDFPLSFTFSCLCLSLSPFCLFVYEEMYSRLYVQLGR